VSARTAADLDVLVREAQAGAITPFVLDVTDPLATAAVIARVNAEMGPIALAILNAGTHRPTPLAGFLASDLAALIDVNLMGVAHGLAALLAAPTPARDIAVVASLAGYRGLPRAAAYGASKAAVINLIEALKPEADQAGIRLRLINPGFVATPLTDLNDFPMPFLISAEAAADYILRGLAGGRFEIAFPYRFAWIMKLLRILPAGLFFRITRGMVAK
ncbi:MAG: SDR family NAD(P)-dependent oxidoreductase, partial [Pseudomonadota bacterium]|nr:SDR family NAD(P)-dependent oxidoreductase [Pseudomonadota bacterium]